MLISNFYKTNFINHKKNRTNLKTFHKKLILIILFLFITSFYFLNKTKNSLSETKFNFLNTILINNGFIIKNIEISGVNHLNKNDIIKIINAYNHINIFNVNIKKIYKEIKNNTWIKNASIEIIYPSTIKILLTEKKPVAIWQNKSGNILITKSGNVIFEKNLEKFKNYLPIVIGQNAHKNAHSILNILSINKDFVKNIWSLTYVNERRWDVHFNQGLTIRLPSDRVEKAWEKVLYLDKKFNILNLDLTELDLRNSSQILGKINIDKNLIYKKKNS